MEHRLSPRMPTDISATVQLGTRTIRCRVKNVNAEGLYIEAPVDDIRIHAQVQVVMEKAYGMMRTAYRAMVVRLVCDCLWLMFMETCSLLLGANRTLATQSTQRELC